MRATQGVFGLRWSAARPKISTPSWERRLSGDHDRRFIVANHLLQEREERWGDLCGPDAATRRLQDIEMHLGQVHTELREIGRWAKHPVCPNISMLLKRTGELLNMQSERSDRRGQDDFTASASLGSGPRR